MAADYERKRSKARRVLAEELAKENSPAAQARGAERAMEYSGYQLDLIQEEVDALVAQGRMPPIACKKGCAHCCHAKVTAQSPEIHRLAAYIRSNFSPGERAALDERLSTHRARLEDWVANGEDRPPTPCPLLVDDCCTVHPARPFTCRAFNSVDVRACISAKENWREEPRIPGVGKQVHTMSALHAGMSDALRECGLSDEMVEMPTALQEALGDTAP